MEIKLLYRFLRDDGGVTESLNKPDGVEYTTRFRLIAFDGSAAKTFNVTAAALGLSGAMHFRGTVTAIPPTGTYASGDVVLFGKKRICV